MKNPCGVWCSLVLQRLARVRRLKTFSHFLARILSAKKLSRVELVDMAETTESSPPPSKKLCLEKEEEECESQNGGGKTSSQGLAEPLAPLEEAVTPFVRIKRRKFALLLSYNGKGYKGMQWNPGFPTIEEDLLAAMCKAVAFPKDMAGDLGKLHFQRCARTDKGVSAARQVVSLKIKLDDAPALINTHLPPHIRVIVAKRVTKSFDARHACSGRRYEYLLPTYALAPYHKTTRDYRVPDETVEYLDRLLGRYVGTHNYHNFTSGKKFEEMSSKRYITSFKSESKFVVGDVHDLDKTPLEFLALQVKGQSFVLHQIRKMIGFVVAIIRGYVKESEFDNAFLEDKMDIPRAPALGLILENVYFDHYNAKFANCGERERLEWDEYDDTVDKFKREHIHRTIIETEQKEMSMMQWLHTLQIHNFYGTAQRLEAELEKSASEVPLTTPGESGGVPEEKITNKCVPDPSCVANSTGNTSGSVPLQSSTCGSSQDVESSTTGTEDSARTDENTSVTSPPTVKHDAQSSNCATTSADSSNHRTNAT